MTETVTPQDLLEQLKGSPDEVDFQQLRYALYVRKSTTSEDKQASSIEDQVAECMEKVIIPNELNVVKIYDESFSAKVADTRVKFNNLINDIENGRIDGLIAWHPDRLSRNMKEAGAIIDLVDRGLIKDLRFSTFTFENNPAGKMLLGITFVMAKQYSEHLAESVDRGNKRAVEDGEFIGKYKHGYVVDEKRQFQPDPHSFILVKQMFEMALEGKSQKDIRLWINEQSYKVQKKAGSAYVDHEWDKDDVSKLLRDPHYAGVHKWGKNLMNLVEAYDFETMISVDQFLKINHIKDLTSPKVLAIHRPRPRDTRAKLLNGIVYCSECEKTLTSMIIDKKNKETGVVLSSRYYYKCETEECKQFNKSARAGLVVDAAQDFFNEYLFVTKGNYQTYVKRAKQEAKRQAAHLDSSISGLKTLIANKQKSYDKTKSLVLNDPRLQKHYNLDDYATEISELRSKYEKAKLDRNNVHGAISTFEEYLKLFTTIPVILGKIREMDDMDAVIRIFFSNFTIHPTAEGTFRGATVSYELKEPWKGFIENGDFVSGAGTGTLTRDLFLGKEAL